jgi:hypothetical protein
MAFRNLRLSTSFSGSSLAIPSLRLDNIINTQKHSRSLNMCGRVSDQ